MILRALRAMHRNENGLDADGHTRAEAITIDRIASVAADQTKQPALVAPARAVHCNDVTNGENTIRRFHRERSCHRELLFARRTAVLRVTALKGNNIYAQAKRALRKKLM
jgi:hypothetical protein